MKIICFPADLTGCGHYRMIWPAAVMQQGALPGWEVLVVPPDRRGAAIQAKMSDETVIDVTFPPCDVMVFQRVTHNYLAQAIGVIRSKGVRVIHDIDDDLETIHPGNPAWAMLHPNKNAKPGSPDAKHSWKNCQLACANASLVTVSSDALLKRYGYRHGAVLRNHIPEHFLSIPWQDSDVVGWGGSVHSHPDDITQVGSTIARLVRDGIPYRQVGPVQGVQRALRLDTVPEHTGVVEQDDWPYALAELGIGIAPLADTAFNAAKSWLKPLEYAAVGVPSVISPRAEYRRIAKLGIGDLADKPADWYRKIRRLALDSKYRADRALEARAAACNLTIQGNVNLWIEAWTGAPALARPSQAPMALDPSIFGTTSSAHTSSMSP
jgi:hypothetical protein